MVEKGQISPAEEFQINYVGASFALKEGVSLPTPEVWAMHSDFPPKL